MGGLDRFAACDMRRYIEIVKQWMYVYVLHLQHAYSHLFLLTYLYPFSHFRYTYGFSTSHSWLPWPMPSWGIPRRVVHAAARKKGSYIQGPAGSQALRPGGEVLTFSDEDLLSVS